MKRWLLLAALVAGCGQSLTSGQVVNKVFEQAHYEEYQSRDYVGQDCDYETVTKRKYNSRTGEYENVEEYEEVCESEYEWRTHTRWVPDTWKVLVRGNCSSPRADGQVECQEGWKPVSQQWWDQAENGSYYDEREQ